VTSVALRYGLAVLSIAVALGLALGVESLAIQHLEVPLFLISIVVTVWNAVVKPVDFLAFVNAIKELGVFWAVINEPPPGSIRKRDS
jgi:uncharacterized membrane protein YvlD (DUF360 family)